MQPLVEKLFVKAGAIVDLGVVVKPDLLGAISLVEVEEGFVLTEVVAGFFRETDCVLFADLIRPPLSRFRIRA